MKRSLIILTLIAGAAAVRAGQYTSVSNPTSQNDAVFQASLTPAIAIHPRTTKIRGFAINLWGENPQESFNPGVVNGSTGNSEGFSWGVVNYDDFYTGVQWGLFNYSRHDFTGWQEGMVNVSRGDFTGWQDGMINITQGKFTGLQNGWVNVAGEFHGLQAGIVNYAKNLHGLQLGFINVAMNNGWFDRMPDQFAKGFPIVNWSF